MSGDASEEKGILIVCWLYMEINVRVQVRSYIVRRQDHL